MLGMLGLIAGAGLLTAAAAQAVTGSGPGQLALHPPSGATTLQPTWTTTTACPAGFQTSATLFALNTDGSIGSAISVTVNAPTSPITNGQLLGPIGHLISLGTNVTAGRTTEFVVGCFAGNAGTGNRTYVQAEWVTLSANGSTYTTSSTPPASPNPTSTPTPAGASASSPTPVSTGTPSGSAATGGGEASLSGSGNNVQLGLGAAALAGSAVVMGLAIRRARGNW